MKKISGAHLCLFYPATFLYCICCTWWMTVGWVYKIIFLFFSNIGPLIKLSYRGLARVYKDGKTEQQLHNWNPPFCCFLSQNFPSREWTIFNPILHTAWLNNHALTLKRNTAKYYFGEKSSFLHTFLNICCESRKFCINFAHLDKLPHLF